MIAFSLVLWSSCFLVSYLTVKHLTGLCLVTWVSPDALSIVPVYSLVEYSFLEWFPF